MHVARHDASAASSTSGVIGGRTNIDGSAAGDCLGRLLLVGRGRGSRRLCDDDDDDDDDDIAIIVGVVYSSTVLFATIYRGRVGISLEHRGYGRWNTGGEEFFSLGTNFLVTHHHHLIIIISDHGR